MIKLLSSDDFRSAAKQGERPEGTVFRFAATDPQMQDEATRTMRFVFSDATVDHSGDTIDPKGWQLDIFKRNPVALFSHMSWEPPIGRASNVHVEGQQLVGDIEFATADVYEFADTIYRLVKGKFLNAVSVGFKPVEWAFSSDKARPYGIDFKKQTLLEISVCPVPCNPNALNEARSVGINTRPLVDWAEKVLDSTETAILPKSDLAALREQAGAPQIRYYVQTEKALSADAEKHLRESMDSWAKNRDSLLILPQGITLRSVGGEQWHCGAARDLPLDASSTNWDGAAAAAAIFEHAGGIDFDPEIARKGFLAYNAVAPKLRGSYKLPIAHMHGDTLKADAAGIRAAASRLPDTDIPDDVKAAASAVIDHYEAQMTDNKTIAPTGKAGRRVSAATGAKLQEVLDHVVAASAAHDAITKCIKDIMTGDGPDGEPDGDTDDVHVIPSEPVGTVVLQTESLTPAQKRLAEARALRAALPTND
jgi:HK97 family phage prohead protease